MVEYTSRRLPHLARLVWRPLWADGLGNIPEVDLRRIVESYRSNFEDVIGLKGFTLLATYGKPEGLRRVCLGRKGLQLRTWEGDEWRR